MSEGFYYHALVSSISLSRAFGQYNIEIDDLHNDYIYPFIKKEDLNVNNNLINESDINRFKVIQTVLPIDKFLKQYPLSFRHEIFFINKLNKYNTFFKDVTTELLKEGEKSIYSQQKSLAPVTETSIKKVYKKVMIINGNDDSLEDEVSNYLKKLDLVPVFVKNKTSNKLTLDKLVDFPDADYAVVIYSPCDRGYAANDFDATIEGRPTQNVVFEHGYLLAKLGKEKIFTLFKGDLSIFFNYRNTAHAKYADQWKLKLAKELTKAGFDIDIHKL